MMGSDRNLRPLSEATQPLYAGVDLGGTSIKAALVDDEGRLVAFHTEPTHAARGPEDAAARMGRMVHTPLMLTSLSASKSRCSAERSNAWVSTHFPVRPVKSRTGACFAPAAEISSRSL